ncbi:MAG TPA: PLP-dependent aminotransferase family protein [Candidatus Obscuribacterales bacterium]
MDLIVNLPPKSFLPLHRQLADALCEAIDQRRLLPGEPMPSTRDLAQSLRISRSTVVRSYEELHSRGYLESAHGSGTFVRSEMSFAYGKQTELNKEKEKPRIAFAVSAFAVRLLHAEPGQFPDAASYSTDDLAPVLRSWKRLWRRHLKNTEEARSWAASNPIGIESLRKTIADFLWRTRRIHCHPDQVIAFSNKQSRLQLVCRLLFSPGDLVAVQDPISPEVRQMLSVYGARVVPVPLDQEGINIDHLLSIDKPFKAICLANDDHNGALSREKRRCVRDLAKRTGAFIIEEEAIPYTTTGGSADRYPLRSSDDSDRVIYLSAGLEMLSPLMMMSFLVAPYSLQEAFAAAKACTGEELATIEQLVLRDFIEDGLLEHHLRGLERLSNKRRCHVIHLVTKHLGRRVDIESSFGSQAVVINLSSDIPDSEVVQMAQESGLLLSALSNQFACPAPKGKFMLFPGSSKDALEEGIETWITKLRARGLS